MRLARSLAALLALAPLAAARAEPPRRLPALPSPGALSLSVDVWRARSGDRVESGARATVSIGFDKLAAPRPKLELGTAPPTPAPQSLRVDVAAGLPTLRSDELARVLRAAWRVADLAVEDDRLDRLARRARASAGLPEVRLRAGRAVDRSVRVTTDDDSATQHSTGGVGTFYEVRATFRLDRAIFADEEVALARLRRERADDRRKLTRDVLDATQALLRALAKAKDPSASVDEHLDAEARAVAAALALDALTGGVWSGVWAAAVAREAARTAPAPSPPELECAPMVIPTLQAALGGMIDAAEIVGLDGRFVYVNPAFERVTGHRAGALVGRAVDDVHRAVSLDEASSGWRGRLDVTRASGDTVALEGSFSVARDDAGAPICVLGLWRDVTRRARDDLGSDHEDAFYRQVFHANQAIKLLVDPVSGAIEDANQAAVEFYGYTLDELRGMPVDRINTLPPERVRRALELARSGGTRTFRFRHRLKSGEIRDVEVFSGGVELGERALLLSIIHDVGERARAEEQLARVQRMESLGRLAGGVAHDFNNLLFVVLSEARRVLRALAPDDPLRADVERVRDAATRASELTRHLLLFARGGDVTPEPSDVGKTLRGVAALVASSLGDGVELTVETPPDARPVAYVATTQLEQVLMNLIMNAREAMPGGGHIAARLRVVTAVDGVPAGLRPGDYAELAIADDGAGMPTEVAAHVFEPFFTTKGPKHGTGLGLATTYGIVQRAGGAISVDSEVGVGTTFRVWLPLIDALEHVEAPDDGAGRGAGASSAGDPRPPPDRGA